MFMFTEGLGADAKITFHSRDAVVAYRSEKMADLIRRGLVEEGARRQTESVPILDDPFLVCSIAFFPEVMKPTDKRKAPPGKPMTVIVPPVAEEFVRIHVVHSYDEPAELQDHVSGKYLRWFARLRSGRRHLTFFHIAYQVDWESEKEKLRNYVEQIPARDDLIELAQSKDLSAIFWDVDNNHLNFFEVHGLSARQAGTPTA